MRSLCTDGWLWQFDNGAVREKYRKMFEDGELTAEQLEEIIRGKRSEVVREVVDGGEKVCFVRGGLDK